MENSGDIVHKQQRRDNLIKHSYNRVSRTTVMNREENYEDVQRNFEI
jgi:hypothetical protein